MDYVFIGKIVNTHGIKGELRIKSNFDKRKFKFRVAGIIEHNNKVLTVRMGKNYRRAGGQNDKYKA